MNPEQGTRPVAVLAVHGNGGGAFRFARAVPHMPPDVPLHPVTLPGFGGRPRDPGLRTMADYAARIAEEAAALPRPRVLLGHGIGASMLLELGPDAQEVADALVLHAPVGPRLDRRLLPLAMRLPGARGALRRLIAARPLRGVWRRMMFSPAVPADYSDRFLAGYAGCEAFSQMFDLITPEWFDGLRPTPVPAVLLWGARDRVLAAGHATDVMHLLPRGRREVVPGWGHFPMIEDPEGYAAHVASLARGLVSVPA